MHPSRISSSARAARSASPISSSGNSPTPSCTSPTCCGRTSAPPPSTRRSRRSGGVSGASAAPASSSRPTSRSPRPARLRAPVLLTRVLTALALLPVILGMLFLAPPGGWALFALVIALLACWEWSRMCGFTPGGQGLYLAASAVIGAYVWLLSLRYAPGNFAALALTAFIIAAFFWIVAAPTWLSRLARPSTSIRAVAGWIVVWPLWFALVMLRETSPWLLLAI